MFKFGLVWWLNLNTSHFNEVFSKSNLALRDVLSTRGDRAGGRGWGPEDIHHPQHPKKLADLAQVLPESVTL